jgi:hypothetical protein
VKGESKRDDLNDLNDLWSSVPMLTGFDGTRIVGMLEPTTEKLLVRPPMA